MATPLLEIEDLYAGVDGKEIIKGFNLTINAGEIHALMGPNGAGKSTLSNVLCGKPGYHVTSGRIPVEIPGVPITSFLKHAVNAVRQYKGEDELDTMEFIKILRQEGKSLGLDADMIKRDVNVGFSGGEKKRLETLQMSILKPTLAILDEADSGLDIDALRVVAEGVNALHTNDNALLVITHYQRLLNYIVPDFVHIYADGKIVKTGGKELAMELEQKGYAEFVKERNE